MPLMPLNPIRIGGFTIHDFHGQHRVLTVPEIFQYSSNIGTAKIADLIGIDAHKEFLTRMGLLNKMDTELPEVKMPSQHACVEEDQLDHHLLRPRCLHDTAADRRVAGAALVNGGKLIEPTFLPRTREQADAIAKTVVKKSTSDDIRFLLDFNGSKGSGRAARVPGYDVGSKTGTADKVVNGRYSHTLNFNTFLAAFPIDNPQYVIA